VSIYHQPDPTWLVGDLDEYDDMEFVDEFDLDYEDDDDFVD
jgi:hypothetical protein